MVRKYCYVLSAVTLFLVVGCTAAVPPSAGPWAAEVAAAQQGAKSQFQEGVLADGVVTRAEYDEAAQRLVACGQDRGVAIQLTKVGSRYNYSFGQGDMAIFDACRADNMGDIGALYEATTLNPDRQSPEELLVSCLARVGLVDSSYTAANLTSDKEKDSYPFDRNDQRFADCTQDPYDGQH